MRKFGTFFRATRYKWLDRCLNRQKKWLVKFKQSRSIAYTTKFTLFSVHTLFVYRVMFDCRNSLWTCQLSLGVRAPKGRKSRFVEQPEPPAVDLSLNTQLDLNTKMYTRFPNRQHTRKPSLEVAPITLAAFLSDCEFTTGGTYFQF